MSEEQESFMFEKENYVLMIAGFALVLLGFVLMIGGKSEDPTLFNEEIFNTQRITVAPLTCLLGFAIVGFGIMKKPKVEE